MLTGEFYVGNKPAKRALPSLPWEKRLRTRPGRVPDASHATEFEETDASRTRPGRVPRRFSLQAYTRG
eukprot:gene9309-biopygen15242